MTTDTLELDGKSFVLAEQVPIPEWPCVLSERPQPTLTIKDNDLFLVTDTLGNIAGCLGDDTNASMGLFCHDTRFLSRLELQINGHSPVLLSSTSDKGFGLSVLCTNPSMDGGTRLEGGDKLEPDVEVEGSAIFDLAPLRADTVGINREIVLNGALFEELTVCNYSTSSIRFQLSLSFDADFVDLFVVRGYGRKNKGQLLRLVPKELAGLKVDTLEHSDEEFQPTNHSTLQPSSPSSELTLAYKGLDGSLMESRIEFVHLQPDYLKGYTAVWELELSSHETQKLGYRLQMMTNNRPTSRVSAPATLAQARAAELSEEQEWLQHVTQIRSDKNTFNRVIERAEQDAYLLRQSFGKGKVLSAGVPWFSTLFGRDSIIAASQIMMLDPTIACETLTILAEYQGKQDDDWRDEQPGKILHELRMGEMARCQEIPHTPYYGTAEG